MKHKTSELEGALLDAAVAKAEGMNYSLEQEWSRAGCFVMKNGANLGVFAPSVAWLHGGPVIERERIGLHPPRVREDFPEWLGTIGFRAPRDEPNATFWHQRGPTPLIAAMRAYTASVFGEEVELP